MLELKKIRNWAIVVGAFMASPALATTLISFDAQTNPSLSNPAELSYNGALATGAGSLGNGDGGLFGTGLAPGLTLITPLSIASGTLGEQNNANGSTTFNDVTLQLTGLNAVGGAGVGFLVQDLSSGTFAFSSSKPGGGPGALLLSGTFASALIDGASGASSGGVLSSTITYTGGSIYLKLLAQGGSTAGSESISMTHINAALGNTSGGPLNSFAADANGTFSTTLLPEPASVTVLMVGGAALLRRRRV